MPRTQGSGPPLGLLAAPGSSSHRAGMQSRARGWWHGQTPPWLSAAQLKTPAMPGQDPETLQKTKIFPNQSKLRGFALFALWFRSLPGLRVPAILHSRSSQQLRALMPGDLPAAAVGSRAVPARGRCWDGTVGDRAA